MKKCLTASRCVYGDTSRVQVALFTVQLGYGVYYVLTKVAMTAGVNQFVFAVYRDLLALIVVGPLAYFREKNLRTAINFQTASLIFALGCTGIFLQQTFFLAGLMYTNTAFASAMQNSIPVFTFLIAVLLKFETLRLREVDGLAKVSGILTAVVGAFIMCLYKGKLLLGAEPVEDPMGAYDSNSNPGLCISFLLSLGIDYWKIGCLCLVANCICMAIYTNLQIPALKCFPAPVSLSACSIGVGAIALLVTGIACVTSASEWILSSPGNIVSVMYAGAIASGLNFSLQTWANQRAGPVLVAAYIPLQTVFSVVLGVMVLNDPLYLGSVLGATLILLGLYLVIWGQNLHKQSVYRESLSKPFHGVEGAEEPLLSGLAGSYGTLK